MRRFAAIAGLAVGFVVLALACSGSGSSQSGAGGSGVGGVSGSGGTTAGTDAAIPGSGGTTPGSGGTTTATTTPPGSGGATPTGGARTGGTTTTTTPGSGGTTPVTGVGGTIGSGGRTGSGGVVASGGVTASGGRTSSPGGDGGTSTGGRPATGGAAGGGSGGATLPRTGGSGGGGNGGTTSTSTAAVPSAGCGKAPPADGRQNISVGGTSREFILKIPANYDNNHPYRLIFGFHGAKYNDDWVATGQAGASGTNLSGPWFGLEAESSGSAIFVAPQAASGGWGSSDLAFVDAMISQFESQLCIDKSRIFSTGFSMGAIMTLTLGCNRAAVFRGIAPMSGSLPKPCPDTQPIAYWSSHGTNDTTIQPSQGMEARDSYVIRNGCTSQTSTPNSNNCVTYQGCTAGYPVIWCTFPGVHDPAPFAGPEIWSFLAPL